MKDTNISQTKNLYTPGRQKEKTLFLIYRNTIKLLKDWGGSRKQKNKATGHECVKCLHNFIC